MKTAKEVDSLIAEWKKPVYGYTKAELVSKIAEACLGWSYVFAAAGALCNPKNRTSSYNGNVSRHYDEAQQIKKRCQVLSGKKAECKGCTFYPGGETRFFDCRGFTKWTLAQVGITLTGAGATSQWNTAKNWAEKGDISKLPKDKCCVLFWKDKKDPKVMAHTGLYVGGANVIIHCSGTVKTDNLTTKGWTDYAIPVGMYGDVPVPTPVKPTIKRNSTGEYVKELQTDLIKLGYNLGASGADGKFGAKTEAAVKEFQAKNNLTSDGIVGKKTWEVLNNAVKNATDETLPKKLYTVTIEHLTSEQADAIVKQYTGAKKTEERG